MGFGRPDPPPAPPPPQQEQARPKERRARGGFIGSPGNVRRNTVLNESSGRGILLGGG